MDDPSSADMVGEARMLELVGKELAKHVTEGIRTERLSDQAAALVRLHKGMSVNRIVTLAFEAAGAAGAAWDGDGATADERGQLPHAPGRQHRRRHDGDGAQRHQRACAGHAARAHAGQGRPVP